METKNIPENSRPYRQSAINTLAVIGFVALVVLGVWGAIYSSRYVPATVNNIGAAAVYVGSLFTPTPAPGISVVPTASSTVISFGNASSTTGSTGSPQATTATTTSPPPSRSTAPGTRTTVTYPINGSAPAAPVLYGLPDLAVTISAIGYLQSESTDSFVADSSVPSGRRPAIKFTVKNIGTNVSGGWRFNASVPTRRSFTYKSPLQQVLNPGDSIDYTLGFDQASSGEKQELSITLNPDHTFTESNTANNNISVNLTIN